MSSVRDPRSSKVRTALLFVSERVTMSSSQMFCELAALDTAELAKCGGDDGKVHRVTAGVVDSRICSFANDAPAGCWVVLRQQPVGAVLPQAEVLLVAVQAADTMWVIRSMTRKTFLQAVEAERFDQRADGGMEQAVMLAAALLPSNVLRVMPDRPPSGNAGKLEQYARKAEMQLEQSGELARLGLPMELMARGGFFPADLPAVVMHHVGDLERRASQIRFDNMMMSPQNAVPLSLQEPPPRHRTVATAREAIAMGLAEGTPSHLSPSYRPLVLDYGYGDDYGVGSAGDGGSGGVAGRSAVCSSAPPAVVPLAAVPPEQAVAAGLPEAGVAQQASGERRWPACVRRWRLLAWRHGCQHAQWCQWQRRSGGHGACGRTAPAQLPSTGCPRAIAAIRAGVGFLALRPCTWCRASRPRWRRAAQRRMR